MRTSTVILLALGVGSASVGCWVMTHDPVSPDAVSTTTTTSAELDGGEPSAPPPPPRRQPKNWDVRDISQDTR